MAMIEELDRRYRETANQIGLAKFKIDSDDEIDYEKLISASVRATKPRTEEQEQKTKERTVMLFK